MGEVYRARDPKLDRDVALKVLPEAFSADSDRLARFEREAKTLAALNHPNIAQIYGFEHSGPPAALVMELVEGEDLARRIARGPIPIDESLAIARQIADALEAAHDRSIVHRDLKPANVKVRGDGTVKVLDFGLAKALEPATAMSPGITQSPTLTSPALMTGAGMLLGTAAYMSPEQAKGKPADKRSDIWAFGCVVYEMLTGARAFPGEDISETLASILKSDPDWSLLPPDVPPAMRMLMRRCLMKDPRLRVSDMSAVILILSELDNLGPSLASLLPASPRSRWRRVVPAATSAALAAVVVAAVAWKLRPIPNPPIVSRFSFSLPQDQSFSGATRQMVTISPDGTRLAYVANSRIYLRSIGELEPHAIAGLDDALSVLNPMFAPDGRSIAFFSRPPGGGLESFELRRVPVDGGAPSTLASVGVPCGATWSPEGVLYATTREGIFRVPPNGGTPVRIAGVGANEIACGPHMLPGGRTVLFTVAPALAAIVDRETGTDIWDKGKVVAQSLTDGSRRVLIDGGSDARYLPTGHLMYGVAGTMYAARFDAGTLEITGAAVPVVGGVRRSTPGQPTSATHLAVSDTGTLMYVPGPATSSTTVFNLVLGDGRSDPVRLNVPPAAYVHPRVSPDGRVLAVGRNDGDASDIWTYDLAGNTELRRLTFGGSNRYPVWSGDGRRVSFQSEREGDRGIFWQPVEGKGNAERLTRPRSGEAHVPHAWSRDGRHLLFSVVKGQTSSLWIFALATATSEPFGAERPQTPRGAAFSPDGRWVVYAWEREGIFVEPFPATGEKYQLPRRAVDFHPAWAADSKNIFFVPGSTEFVSVPVIMDATIAFGAPVDLPRGPRTGLQSWQPRGYDVLPDGRFVSVSVVVGDEIRVVLDWFQELKRLVPPR